MFFSRGDRAYYTTSFAADYVNSKIVFRKENPFENQLSENRKSDFGENMSPMASSKLYSYMIQMCVLKQKQRKKKLKPIDVH